ncbi:hypothetical protein SmJEL517_g03448 [Synchytrium microbalum]|uniref:t-SNARE coiled-coil homology domain-containing protein n=1 Tax=Synchytrium microbalum TaxID=1806994 RepID=A0A507C3Q9_9FUNG|nr:uncharacterized protein SmJEL517_g03448 [Synchytrium microbalum]TPX33709.1 hypothetical protein SmJEL517_g03448 [Synchytrium microbalum]
MGPRDRNEEASASLLESQNDANVDSLFNKVRAIKGVSMSIHDDVRSQNTLLDGLTGSMDNVQSRLKSTFNRVTIMMKKPHNRNFCWMVAGMVFVFFVLYWMASRRGKEIPDQ